MTLNIFLEITRPKHESECEIHKFKVENNLFYDVCTKITKKSDKTEIISAHWSLSKTEDQLILFTRDSLDNLFYSILTCHCKRIICGSTNNYIDTLTMIMSQIDRYNWIGLSSDIPLRMCEKKKKNTDVLFSNRQTTRKFSISSAAGGDGWKFLGSRRRWLRVL